LLDKALNSLIGMRSLSGPRRLDGGSKALLTASLGFLGAEEPGWITMQEAERLFSPVNDAYAFGEIDEIGKSNLAAFAAEWRASIRANAGRGTTVLHA
jgi:hypothetical protein